MSTPDSPAPQIVHNSFSFLRYLHSNLSDGEKVTKNPDYEIWGLSICIIVVV